MKFDYRNTGDGSVTCYSSLYDEWYHGYAGAWLEAERVYVQGTALLERSKTQKEMAILDIGFGLGYNCLVAIYHLKFANPELKVKLVSLEMDGELVAFDQYPQEKTSCFHPLLDMFFEFKTRGYFIDQQYNLRLIQGDARHVSTSS